MMKPGRLVLSGGLHHPIVWAWVLSGTFVSLYLCDLIWWLSVPMVLSVVGYYICKPFIDEIKRRGLTHHWAMFIFLILATLVLLPLLVFSATWIANKFYSLKVFLPDYLANLEGIFWEFLDWIEETFPRAKETSVVDRISERFESLQSEAIETHLPTAALGTLGTIPSLLLVPYLLFFFLKDGAKFKRLIMRGVPNAFFEKVLMLFHQVDTQVKMYFRGLFAMTLLDTVTLAFGLWIIGLFFNGDIFSPGQSLFLGLLCAVLSWVPYVGTFIGCLIIMTITLAVPEAGWLLQVSTILLFVAVRTIDDFIYTPMTVGRSLQAHPLVTVLVIFIGGFIGGITGLLLAMPILGVWMVLGEVYGQVWQDGRLVARHQMSSQLRKKTARQGWG
ncbi:MAG: AI-2E family transporter [Verrucomicrobiota bacterium]